MATRKNLTKAEIEKYGITIELDENNQPHIFRTSQKHGFSKEIRTYEMVQHDLVGKHKYGKDKYYKAVIFSYENKSVTLLVHRLVYVYFKEDILDPTKDIDHVDKNPLNNDPKNLELISHKENILRRDAHRNQYTCGMTQEEIEELRAIKANKDMKLKKLHQNYKDDTLILKQCKEKLAFLRSVNASDEEILDAKYYIAVASRNQAISRRLWKQEVKKHGK